MRPPLGSVVEIPAEGTPSPSSAPIPAYAALPAGAVRGVVVIHELFGRQPEIDRVVERFAARGYAAVEPDLFAGGRLACIRGIFEGLQKGTGREVERAARVRRWLCQAAGLDEGRVGIIGFCLGGGFALAVGRGWGAVSTNYGEVPRDERALRGMGPTIGCYGGRDRVYGRMGPVLEARLRAVGAEVESHTFPTVGHSFLTDGNHPVAAVLTRLFLDVSHDPEVAEQAWERIMAFFDRHLAAPPA